MFIKFGLKILTVIIAGQCVTPVTAEAGKLDNSINRAIYQKRGTQNVRVTHRHGFNMKPVHVKRVYADHEWRRNYFNFIRVYGRLSHRRKLKRDNQYEFRIYVNRSGQIYHFEERITRDSRSPFDVGRADVWRNVPLNTQFPFSGIDWEADARKIAWGVAQRAAQICLPQNAPWLCFPDRFKPQPCSPGSNIIGKC